MPSVVFYLVGRAGKRPVVVLPERVRYRFHVMREAGWSLAAIAQKLNADCVPTAHGGKRWYPSTASKVLGRGN